MSSSRLPARPTARTTSRPAAFPPATAKAPTRNMAAAAAARKKGSTAAAPPNHSILSFFKKVAPPEESMFVAGGGGSDIVGSVVDVDLDMDCDEAMEQAPAKRRRLSGEPPRMTETQTTATASTTAPTRPEPTSTPPSAQTSTKAASNPAVSTAKQPPRRGPFLDDSDEEEDANDGHDICMPSASSPNRDASQTAEAAETVPSTETAAASIRTVPGFDHRISFEAAFPVPKETGEQTDKSVDDPVDDAAFWDDDENFEGEEFQERVYYMEEQARLEAEVAAAAAMAKENPGAEAAVNGDPTDEDVTTASCPICSMSLAGRSPEQAAVHVNACLDSAGTADPVPSSDPTPAAKPHDSAPNLSAMSNRFLRTAQPRPGQANPIGLDGGAPGSSGPPGAPGGAARSAFSKLMLGHAEDAAWAAAAASEHASRGRPAYERTCPFYKIMPGLAICVDAFRYGAVEGCRAYFLSHFHSDHYVGLTARWCHGPIYCSRVTASLVKTQLGTAAKWVVALDWETPVDVPGTDGVRVTMLPANHCPGSSLFLFEKAVPQQQRTLRILHCGDFRACPAHVRHPLLRPDAASVAAAVDTATGTLSAPDAEQGGRRLLHGEQQKIDVCYLDTTYLNPRYAFPPQDDVVKACASLCAALDRSLRAGDEAAWHRILHRREGSGSGSIRAMFAAATAAAKTEVHDSINGDTPGEAEAKTEPEPENALSLLGKPPRTTDRNRLLVVCGTYSIGKERLCKAVAQALGSKIYATPAKIKIVAQLGDPELTALMTPHASEAQVHMQMLMEMRGETLAAYLASHQRHFARVVGFRPSGWTYRPAAAHSSFGGGGASAGVGAGAGAGAGAAAGVPAAAPSANLAPGSLPTPTLLHGAGWRSRFGVRDLVPQRGSTRDVLCFGVPYSEHSSFRELALFLMALRIERVVPTVNVGSDASRQRMKAWTDRWLAERRRGGLVQVRTEDDDDEMGADGPDGAKLWDGKSGAGGTAYW